MGLTPERGDVFLVSLDPTLRHEIQKTRPCLIVSPDEMNHHLGTALVAPMIAGGRAYPFRIPCRFKGRRGYIVLNQMKTVDRARLVSRLGMISGPTLEKALSVLREMFAA